MLGARLSEANMTPSTIDFARFLDGSEDERRDTAYALVDSFRRTGFARLVNHGVPLDIIEKIEKQVSDAYKFQ